MSGLPAKGSSLPGTAYGKAGRAGDGTELGSADRAVVPVGKSNGKRRGGLPRARWRALPQIAVGNLYLPVLPIKLAETGLAVVSGRDKAIRPV